MTKVEQLAIAALRRAVPLARIEEPDSGDSVAGVSIQFGDSPSVAVDLRWAGLGFPRDVERAIARRAGQYPLIIAAQSLSTGGRDILNARGISWVTMSGAAQLHVGSILVEREGDTKPPAPRQDGGEDHPRWTESMETIAETVLSGFARSRDPALPSVRELAARAERSIGSVSKAVKEFERLGWTTAEVGRGRTAARNLTRPGPMLESWAHRAVRSQETANYSSIWDDPVETARAIQREFGSDAAFGGRFAADTLAPFSTAVPRLRCYVRLDLDFRAQERRLQAAGVTAFAGDAAVEVASTNGVVLAAASSHGGLRLVSPVRVYADLLAEEARGSEAAAHLRETVLKF